MRALKILVVVMGIMLVGGFATLITVIAGRVAHRQSASSFVAEPLDLPVGARIETMAVGPDRIVLGLALADGERQLVILDLASGRRLGTVLLRTTP